MKTASILMSVIRPWKLDENVGQDQNVYEVLPGENQIVWAFGMIQDGTIQIADAENMGASTINLEFAPELVHLASNKGICVVSKEEFWKNSLG